MAAFLMGSFDLKNSIMFDILKLYINFLIKENVMGKIVEAGERIEDWFDSISKRRPTLMSVVFLLLSIAILGFCVWVPIYAFSKDFSLTRLIIGMFFDFLGILLGGSLVLITTKSLIGSLKREA